MAKVSQGLSFTFRIGPDNKNQYAKISIEVSDIDTEIPFEKQEPKIKEAIRYSWEFTKEKIDTQITEILGRKLFSDD